MHNLLRKIWFANHKFGVSDVFCDLGSLASLQNVLACYSSVAVQWNDFKTFFALFSSFQHTQIFLGNLWQPSNLL